MRAEDIEKLIAVGRPTISRDGSFAVFATSKPSIRANRAVGRLYRTELATRTTRPFTRGIADTAPQISPDDAMVAFLRADAKKRAQLWVVEASGGEPVQVTDMPLGVSAFAWSPDSRRLAFVAAQPERGRYGTVEGLDPAAESPRHITGLRWHANGVGWTEDRPSQLFLSDVPDLAAEPLVDPAPTAGDVPAAIDAVGAEARQLTHGTRSFSGVVFTSSGEEVLSVASEASSNERDLSTAILAVRIEDATVRDVVARSAKLAIGDVAVAADGMIAFTAAEVGEAGADFVAANYSLWIVDGQRLTDPETIDLGEVGSHITALAEDFLVQNRTRGRVSLLRVTRAGAVSEVLAGDIEVTGHAASRGGSIVASAAGETFFGELVDEHGAAYTDFSSALRDTGLVTPREMVIQGRDGYPIHGWVATPEGEGPFPVILQIHGGPYAQYAIHPFDETQVLVDAGYAVVYSNPRGSAGYGSAHGRSIRQAMGTLDYHDVIDFFEAALSEDRRLDGERLGIMGGSYGGYLTAWIIAHDHRFSGAIVERGFLDPISFQGTSDIGSFFGDEYVGTSTEDIARQSPMAVVGAVTTPTLVLHSEQDYRCPLEQATRYYSALKRQGTEAEMLIFPGENHELTRSGQPRHRMERFAAVLDWWERTIPPAGA